MAELPLVLIPAFLVPLFIMLHLTALLRARRLASADGGPATRADSPAPREDSQQRVLHA
jgi:hypothetical protein